MSEYLTYAAVKFDDLDAFLRQCVKASKKVGVRFEVPNKPSSEAHTWVGAFDNGWLFALADPATWELLDVFSKVARDKNLPYLFGSTEGGWSKWSYEYAEGGQVLHRFFADPSIRFDEAEYHLYEGDPSALAAAFDVSRVRLQRMLRQFNAVPVQDFHEMLGFQLDRASTLKFLVVSPGVYAGPSTYMVDLKGQGSGGDVTGSFGEATRAFKHIELAAGKGFGHAASAKATSFAEAGSFAEAHDMVMRLQKANQPKVALSVVDEMLKRVDREFAHLPVVQRQVKTASIHALRGLILFDLGEQDQALVSFQERAMQVNRYLGPDHRAAITGRLGALLVERGRYDEALSPLRLCLAERPLQASTWANLARAAHHCDRDFEARQAALQGLAADPNYDGWTGVMRDLRLNQSDLLPERKPKYSSRYRREAKELMRQGNKRQALAKFRLSLHHNPADLDCAWGVACTVAECLRDGILEVDQEDVEVIRLLEQVCYGNPTWPWAWGTLVEVLDRFGRDKRARDAADAYGRVHTQRIEDLLDLSLWLAKLNPSQGVHLLEILLERFVELRMRGLSSYDEARDSLKFKALATYGWTLLELGRPQEALEPLIEASQHDPSNADNWSTIAEVHYRLRNWRAANRAVSRSLKSDPGHAHSLRLAERLRAIDY